MKWILEIADCPDNTDFPIKIFRENNAGVITGPKFMSIRDFLGAFIEADPVDDIPEMDFSPTLPLGTIRFGQDRTGSTQMVALEIPKKIWEIRYVNDGEIYSIGFPRLVATYLLRKITDNSLRIVEMRLFAVLDNKKSINDNTKLFTFPYPNVGKDNGIVCWGDNERPVIKSHVELERAFNWFVSAPFNEDLGVMTTLGIKSFHHLISWIKDKPFDDEWLISANKTFGELFK